RVARLSDDQLGLSGMADKPRLLGLVGRLHLISSSPRNMSQNGHTTIRENPDPPGQGIRGADLETPSFKPPAWAPPKRDLVATKNVDKPVASASPLLIGSARPRR